MGAIPYAFSVHHFISTVGADAGFAAIIGLAILILLYFSQARETASLREWAGESAEQVRQLEARLAQLTRAQGSSPASTTTPVPPPPGIVRGRGAPAAAAARVGTGSRGAMPVSAPLTAMVPAAPAGVGAPALSAATRLIPSSDREEISIRAGSATGVASQERSLVDGDTIMAPAGPPPATAAGAANGSTPPRVPAPAGAGVLSSQPPAQAPPRRGELPGSARPPARPGGSGPRRPGTPRGRGGSSGGRSRIGRGVIAVLGLLGLIAVVVVVLVVTSGSANSSKTAASGASATNSTQSHQRRSVRAGTTVTPSSVTVAVLNGTSTTNLAHTIAGRLSAVGFKEGTVATAADQTHTATLVGYLPHHRPAALVVARSLKLGSASVQAVDQSSQTVACPASSSCSAQVVVTVGSDLASNT